MSTVGGYDLPESCVANLKCSVFRQVSVIATFANCESDLFAVFSHEYKKASLGSRSGLE